MMLSPARIVARRTTPRTAISVTTSLAPRRTIHRDEHEPFKRSKRGRTNPLVGQIVGRNQAQEPSKPDTSSSRIWPKRDTPKDAKHLTYKPKSSNSIIKISWTEGFLFVEDTSTDLGSRTLKPTTLRDSCACPKCRDPASGQKSFVSTEIPVDIGIKDVRLADDGLVITFLRDIERIAKDGHEMLLPWSSVDVALKRKVMENMRIPRKRAILQRTGVQYWDKHVLDKHVRKIDYEAYMEGGEAFWDAVIDLCRLGIVYLKNVPKDEESVVRITTRIANIRETFYGRTFDVRAKPNAENVAYTSGYLGLHQDLLYLDPPPMIQVLHCMENSCEGGESLFSDGERVGRLLWPYMNRFVMAPLADHHIPYQYEKNGYHYFSSRYVIDQNEAGFTGVYWSPPFQGRYLSHAKDLRRWIEPARIFEKLINADNAIHQRKMEPGECVLFDNLRVMHGRTAFDAAGGGSRWLRGAYIAGEDFLSKASHIPEGLAEKYRGKKEWSADVAQKELKGSEWSSEVAELVRKIDPSLPEKHRP